MNINTIRNKLLERRREKFGEVYSCDVDGQQLYEEILGFKKYQAPNIKTNYLIL